MSIGPRPKEDVSLDPGVFSKSKDAAKKVVVGFFSDPIHYLFYTSLAGIIACLFFSVRLSWQLYTIVFVLGILKLIKTYQPKTLNIEQPIPAPKKEHGTKSGTDK